MSNEGDYRIEGYTTPKGRVRFKEKELRNAFLEQAMQQQGYEDEDREMVHRFLYEMTGEQENRGLSQTTRGVFGVQKEETKSVFAAAKKKYKKVADKIRPVYQELPEKFRIIRDIKGDPLEGMPQLSRQPPDFVSTG